MHILHVNDLDIGEYRAKQTFFRADLRVNIGFILNLPV